MMMPNSRLNRDFWYARQHDAPNRAAYRRAPRGGLRVRIGHGLIGVGSWLSGDGVAPSQRTAHGRPA